ncbi:MAG TPA: T9SS type A sorting domain-containing protein [Flavobacteriales bacterium]|jgi:hypothetical protein|nr:T9SS type A sorting domain-containing protein [Flavobacteriales bacterium]
MMQHYTLLCAALLALSTPALAQPANDECDGAMHVNVNPTCVTTNEDAALATQSIAPLHCGGWNASQANDLWYHIIGTGENVAFQATGLGDVDVVVQLLSGACADLDSLDCSDATYADLGTEEVSVTTTLGANYYVRVYPYLTSHADFAYTVCAIGQPGTTGIDEAASRALVCYPNPSNGDMRVSTGKGNARYQLEVVDVAGRIMHRAQQTTDAAGYIALQLNGRLVPGTYALRLLSPAGNAVRPFVVD